jgi:uncharacterized glyoxalase superfamily protein PhnB
MSNPTLFHSLSFADADAGIAFLKALGFVERLVVRNESDPTVVEHAQFAWGDSGGIMFGSADRPGDPGSGWERRVGVASCYLVVPTDADVDAVHERALAAGGVSTRAPVDEDYGGRGCVVKDAEGNQYSIGSYSGE